MYGIANNNQSFRYNYRFIVKKFNSKIKIYVTRIYFIFIIFFCLFCFQTKNINSTQNIVKKNLFLSVENNVEDEIKNNIDNQLNELDFSGVENLFASLDENSKNLVSGNSFLEIVKKFINSENSNIYTNFIEHSIKLVFNDILSFVPYFAIIISIAIVYSLIGQFSSDKTKSTSSIINYVCFSAIAVIVLKLVTTIMIDVSKTLLLLEGQMEGIFPIILTLISSIGGVVTATTFQPLLAILSAGITKLFTNILIPIFIFSIVFSVVGNISKNVKMEKFSKFFNSLFNWIVGIVFTIFIAFLTIHGLTVSSADSISLKTAKFAIKSYVPVLGSYLSDGISLIIASSILVKNAVGATGLVVLISTIFLPILKIIVFMLLLKLVSAIIQTLSDEKVSSFLFSVSKSLNMLIVCLLAIGFMFLISLSILMCCANIF